MTAPPFSGRPAGPAGAGGRQADGSREIEPGEIVPIEDPNDLRLARRASGLLAEFNRAGVLEAADVHVADRLGELGGELDPRVRLAVALTVRALRAGSVCLDLGDMPPLAPHLDWPDAAQWSAAVRASPLVAPGGPLRWDDGLLWLDRYAEQEEQVCADLIARSAGAPPPYDVARLQTGLDRLFPDVTGRQRAAAHAAVTGWTTVLGGGPGTGKTTTVAGILALVLDQEGPAPRVALAAPTGKAAARLQEAVQQAAADLPPADRARLGVLTASTVHRLLGYRPGSRTRFRHDRDNRLPHDVVVVDETSMVSLTLMARLLEAVRPDARLLLVGDPDQLASVEAGAVLADLVAGLVDEPERADASPGSDVSRGVDVLPGDDGPRGVENCPGGEGSCGVENYPGDDGPRGVEKSPDGEGSRGVDDSVGGDRSRGADAGPDDAPSADGAGGTGPSVRPRSAPPGRVVVLDRTWRFSGPVAELAAAVRRGDADTALRVLQAGGGGVLFQEEADALPDVRRDVLDADRDVRAAALDGNGRAAVELLGRHRVLCAHRSGPYGVQWWSRRIERWLVESGGTGPAVEWYPGRPLLVTANDYALGLFNGDSGVVIRAAGDELRAAFPRGSDTVDVVPSRLSQVQTMHALTVHRSQGSQFTRVTVVLPPPESPLLTRELLYTALTRTQEQVRIIGTAAAVRAAVERPAVRASGLRRRLRSAR